MNNKPVKTRCYLGLGSNLDQPALQLQNALAAVAQHPDIILLATSRFYGSKAVGPGPQSDYVNAAACIETVLFPEALLHVLQAIETQQGRIRDVRWGPRTLDLDILLYGDSEISSTILEVPHPRITDRAFVLVPLLDLDPDLRLPDGTCLRARLDYIDTDDVWPLQQQEGI